MLVSSIIDWYFLLEKTKFVLLLTTGNNLVFLSSASITGIKITLIEFIALSRILKILHVLFFIDASSSFYYKYKILVLKQVPEG